MPAPNSISDVIKKRALLYAAVRKYFNEQSVMEVEVPLLGRTTAIDPHLSSMSVFESKGSSPLYLQTSPELFMKRLLCAGSGSIFSIGKSFREGESGKRHNPEFSMLEWYRVGFSLEELIQDVAALVSRVVPGFSYEIETYTERFLSSIGIQPHDCSDLELDDAIRQYTCFDGGIEKGDLDRASALDLLVSEVLEPEIKAQCLDKPDALFLIDFPACQAAMAQIQQDSRGNCVAKRFELYVHGVELANGYLELTDSFEQENRFKRDQRLRHELGLSGINYDKKLIEAMESGMPQCSGVALGLDRLLWFIDQSNLKDASDFIDINIHPYLLFPWDEL